MPKTSSRTQSKKKPEALTASEHAPPVKSAAAVAKAGKSESRRTRRGPGKIIYCTSCSADTLASALRLRDTLIAVHGTIDFCLLLTEHPVVVARLRAELPEVPILAPEEVGCRQWLQLAFYLDRSEYAAAMKAALMRTLLADGNVLYIDPRCEVFSPLGELESALQESDLVLVAQRAEPPPPDAGAPPMDALRADGADLWVVGVAQGAAGERFLGWWQDLLADTAPAIAAAAPPAAALWAVAAAAAPRMKVFASSRYWGAAAKLDLANWNGGGAPDTPDGPLAIVRYPSAHPATTPSRDPIAGDLPADVLHERYLRTLAAAPAQRFSGLPYSFGCYLSGAPISDAHRLKLWQLPRARRLLVDNPFAVIDGFKKLSGEESRAWGYYRRLEKRLDRLTRSFVGSTGAALDTVAPGARDRVYNVLQSLPARGRAVRGYAGNALHLVMPGSRDRIYNAVKSVANSDHLGLRRAASALMAIVGVRV